MEQNYYYNKCNEISNLLGKTVIILFLICILIFSINSCVKREILNIDEIKKVEEVKPKQIDKELEPIVPIEPKKEIILEKVKAPSDIEIKQLPKTDVVKDSIKIIKKYEGFSNKNYRCPGNKISIGYGFDRKVFKRNKISKKEAERYLLKLVKNINRYVDRKVKVELTHGQKVALISFVYNVGKPRFERSTMLKYINSGEFNKASKEFNKWVYCKNKHGKKKLKGLVKRRSHEKRIFLS